MKLLYLANLRLPTEKAHGIQIAKMCEAFAAQYNANPSVRQAQGPVFDSEGRAIRLRLEREFIEGRMYTNDVNEVKVELVVPYRKNKIKEDFFSYYGIHKNFEFKRIWTPDFYLSGRLDRISFYIKNFISAIILDIYTFARKPDIIYSRDELPLYFLSFFRKNIIFEAHKFSSVKKIFYKRFKKAGIKIITISNGLKQDFMSFGFSENKLLIAPDGVDLQEFDLDISKEDARDRVDLPLDKRIVMYTGHLFEWKGANTLLETAKLISNFQFPISNDRNILFVFIGGTEHDMKSFKTKAEGLDNVLILGHKPHKDIPVYLKAADVLVLPNSAREEISSKHTSPLKLFEYMASGQPIVASDLPSVREILNNDNAILVRPDDSRTLAEGIETIVENTELAEKISNKSHQDVQNYTWQRRVQTVIETIKNLI